MDHTSTVRHYIWTTQPLLVITMWQSGLFPSPYYCPMHLVIPCHKPQLHEINCMLCVLEHRELQERPWRYTACPEITELFARVTFAGEEAGCALRPDKKATSKGKRLCQLWKAREPPFLYPVTSWPLISNPL